MIEATENIDLVTMRRQSDLEASQRVYREQESALSQQTSQVQTLVIPAETTAVEGQALPQPPPPAPTISPLTALRVSLVAVLLLGLLLIALQQRRKR